jgi:phosphatidate cytidylyltransferase
MKSLPKRIISAVIALLLLWVVTYYFNSVGVVWLGFTLCALGAYEYQKILFRHFQTPVLLRSFFLVVSVFLLFISIFSNSMVIASWGVSVAAFFAGSLWILRAHTNNDEVLKTISLSALGFIYCAMLPSFALTMLHLQNGHIWFLLLIACVFAGDIFAYFGGILFGKEKLMPNLSPNKTRAGAIAGLAGSIISAGLIQHFALPAVPLYSIAILAVFAGVLAQNGDLFESLIKRVSEVKDSGSIMPGHGGILDRLDGVYFAAPLIYAAAEYFQNTKI